MLRFSRLGSTTLYMSSGSADPGADHGQLFFILPRNTPRPPSSMTLAQTWSFQHRSLGAGYYLFLEAGRTLETGNSSVVGAFADRIHALIPRVVQGQHASLGWVTGDPNTPASVALQTLEFVRVSSGRSELVVTKSIPQTLQFQQIELTINPGIPFSLNGEAGFSLANPGADAGSDSEPDSGGGRRRRTRGLEQRTPREPRDPGGGGGNIYLSGAADQPIDKVGETVTVGLSGAGRGSLQFVLEELVQGDIDPGFLDAAIYYVIPEPTLGRDQSMRFPMLDLVSTSQTLDADQAIDLQATLYPANHLDSRFSFFNPDEHIVRTYFRTDNGDPVFVTPVGEAGFAFTHVPNPGVFRSRGTNVLTFFSLTPVGNYELLLEEQPSDFGRLMGGQSGTEYFSFQPKNNGTPGDVLAFFHQQWGYAPEFGAITPLQDGEPNPWLLNQNYQTSWATVGLYPGTTPNGHIPQYYAQPSDATLHGPGTIFSGDYLEYVEVAITDLLQPAPDTTFPIVPVAGVIAPDDRVSAPIDAEEFVKFEKTIINPTRKATITGKKQTSFATSNGRSLLQTARSTTTPQGMLVSVQDTDWQQLTVAKDAEAAYLRFTDISPEFQDALSSNRLFLVATQESELMQEGSEYSDLLKVTGWPFQFEIGQNPNGLEPPPGGAHAYNNVLIFKFDDKTFDELAEDTRLWANPDGFNANVSEVQTWLKDYIADIRTKVADAPDEASRALYEPLLTILDNPNWSGILGFNVTVPPSSMPCEVQGLLGGIRYMERFKAHHVGFEIAKVVADASDIQKSSIFGLIDYNDLEGSTLDVDYEFIVRKLQVRFMNSAIASFDSDIRIIMNKVIDEQVLAGSFNYLDLKGTYQLANGMPKYTFATPRGMLPKTFNLTSTGVGISLPESVTFTKGTLVAGECAIGSNSKVTSAFQFNGSIKFRSAFSFDFFSFEKMVFSNMQLKMSFMFDPPLGNDNSLPVKPTTYKFSPGDTRIDVSLSRSRQNSLLSNFPLRLNGFHYNEAGIDVTKMGYFEIPSLVPGWSGADKPLYGLSFTIDLGPLSSLMKKGGPKGAIKILAAWEPDSGDVTFGLTLGAGSNGKRELGIDGIFLVSLSHFGFQKIHADINDDGVEDYIYAFFLSNAFLEILGTQLPPGGNFSLVLFVPFNGQSDRVNLENLGWFLSYQSGEAAAAGGPSGAVDMSIAITSATKVTRGATVTFDVAVENKFGLPLKATVRTEIVSSDGRSYGTATGRPLPPAPQTLTKQIGEAGTGTFSFTWRATQSGRYKVVAYASTAGGDAPESGKAESGVIDVDQLTDDPDQAKQKKTSVLSVDYLGIGNRVEVPLSAAELRALNSVEKAISALKTKMTISETGAALTRQLSTIYNPNAGLIIGFDLTIMEFVRLAVVFMQENQVYGALIGFSTKAPSFIKGFQFQVLYKQISDDIGVFHIILKLPDYLRQWNIGTGTLTLPIIGLDIYTNGNFKIDFGFPYDFDFSRSLCFQIIIQVGPVPVPLIASLGLYFSYLTGATSALVPKLGPNTEADEYHQPMFDPVFEAGLGLRFGLGREINKGVLKAGATISLVAMLEGALAWYWPSGRRSDVGTPDFTKFPDWFRVSGQAGLIGRIYGEVDFGVVKASVNVELRAIFTFVFETYADIRFGITLSVEVEASITIAFIELSFSFSAEFSFQFSIPNPMGAPPWAEYLQAGGSTSAQTVRRLQQTPTPLVWDPAAQVFESARDPLELVFTAALTSGADADGNAQAHAVPLLAIERGDGAGDANLLVEAFTRWALFTHLGVTADDSATVSRQDLEDLNVRLNPTPAPVGVPEAPERLISYDAIREFLGTTFGTINIGGTPTAAMQATLFPMVPEMTVTVTTDPEGDDGPDEIVNRDLKGFNLRGQSYHDGLAAYFNLLAVDVQNKSDLAATRNLLQDPPAERSMAETVFEDYFAMLVKSGFNQALEWTRANLELADSSTTTVGELMTALGQGETDWVDSGFDTAAKMSARYFLHGLRMPADFDGSVDPVVRSESAVALYELTGQQVEVNLPSSGTWTLEVAPNGSTSGWISASSALTYTPDAEAITRIGDFSSADTATGIYDDVVVGGVDPLRSQPAMFAFKPRASYERPRGTDAGFIYPIADSLLNRLEAVAGTEPHPALTPLNEGQDATDLGTTTWNWALRIPFTAQRIRRTITVVNDDGSVASNDQPIPNTYEIGGTDEQTRDIIGAFIQYGANSSVASVDLYYQLDGVEGQIFGQSLGANASAGLMKTNLSTVSAPQETGLLAVLPADAYSAQLVPTQAAEFLSLLWEASIVNAPGYYLYYDNGAPLDAEPAESELPEEAFAGTENRANLTLVVRFNQSTAGINALDIRNPGFVEGDLHARLDGELNWLPTLAPGSVAFDLSRSKGLGSTTDSGADLMNLFSLLSYWIEPLGGFTESIHGLPVGPTQGEDTDPSMWSYRQGIKVFSYVTGGSTYRYAAVGKTVTLGFEFLDVFGNALPAGVGENPSTTIPVLYSDPLTAVGTWPGIRLNYTMAGGTLNVTVSFASEGYADAPDDTPAEQQMLADAREAALEGYRSIREQLADPNVNVVLTTTVAPGLRSDHTTAVRTFVDDVIEYFDMGASAPAPLSLVAGISQGDRDAQANIFAVQVGLTIERPEDMVSEEVQANLPDAWRTTTVVPPEAAAGIQAPIENPVFDPNAPEYDMWQPEAHELFATEFETAFPELKVATGLGEDGPHTIWAIRIGAGAGLSYTIENAPSFFAPAPLSKVLQSREGVPIRFSGFSGVETPESFDHIDMDVWGREFLEAVDRFLSPETAVTARQIAPGPYGEIVAAKQDIADAIGGGVTWVVAPEPSDAELTIAQESYRQRLLTKLSSAYDVETAVVYPVTTGNSSLPADQLPPRLFGRVSGTPVDPTNDPRDPRAGYTYSNAKVELSGAAEHLAFLFSSGRTENQAAAHVNVNYAISHLEHDIQDADREGYQSSAWLTLVLPEDSVTIGTVDIPVALREYPLPPELVSHRAVAVYPNSAETLAQTKEWEYHYTINQTARAQDTTFSRITFNVPLGSTMRSLQQDDLDLFDWLARFWREYPEFRTRLDLLAKGVRGFGDGESEQAEVAVTWFANIVAGVASTWATWVNDQAALTRQLEQALSEYEWVYTMTEQLDFADSLARIQLFATSNEASIPPQIPDIEVALEDDSLSRLEPTVDGESGSYAYPWSLDELPETRHRTLFIENLDVLNTENAWGALHLERNLHLTSVGDQDRTTNERFVYQTPETRFVNKVTPLLDTIKPIKMTEDGATKSLNQHLIDTLNALFEGYGWSDMQRLLKVGVRYGYDVRRQEGPAEGPDQLDEFQAYMPVTQLTPFLLDIDPASVESFVSGLVDTMNSWKANELPAEERAYWEFDVSVFAALTATDLPVLRLRRLWLDLDQIG